MKKEANLTWVHLFADFVRSKAIADMGTNAFAVLMTIKAHAAISNGQACPSASTIAEYIGISARQVTRELAKLEKRGHIKKTRTGRANSYALTETVQIMQEGKPSELAHFPYIPALTEKIREELKNYLENGNLPANSSIVIQQLNINVQIGDHNTVANLEYGKGQDQELVRKIESIQAKVGAKKNGSGCG